MAVNRKTFKMDRTAFSMGKMDDGSEEHDYAGRSEKEKLEIAAYLISVAYGFVNKPWPKMDKTKFEMAKR